MLEINGLSADQLPAAGNSRPEKYTGALAWNWHLPTNTVWRSPPFAALLGYAASPGAKSFTEWTNSLHPADKELTINTISAAFREKQEQYTHEYRLQHADGHYLDVLDKGYIRYDPETGKPIGLVGTLTDITVAKQAGRQLKDSSEQFRFLAETVPSFIWTTNEKGQTVYQNQQFYDFTGYTPAQTMGHDWAAVIHPEDVAPTLAAWHEAVATGQDFEVTHRIRR